MSFLLLALLVAGCSGDADESDNIATSEGGGSAGMPALLSQSGEVYSRDASTSAAPPADSAAGAESGGSGSDIAQSTADVLGRKVIRNGTLELGVESVDDSYDRASAVASDLGGYVAESSFSGTVDARNARVVIRVPADRYDDALARLRGLATEVRSISSSAQDVTGEVTDLEAALRNLRAVEAQYVELLSRAQAIPDILQVQERLQDVRAEIDRTEGRRALLTRLTDLATITVQLAPVTTAPAHAETRTPLDAAGEAWEASLDSIRQVAVVGVSVVVYSWWLLPLVAVASLVARRFVRARRGTAPASTV
jgi:hypothetical protein